MKMEKKEDSYYISKVLGGEPDSFAPLVEKYKTMAYNISIRIVGRPEDAEEVAQDSFVKAYRSLAGFEGKSKFSTWLFRIVYNTSVSYIRKKRRESFTDDIDSKMKAKAEPIDEEYFHEEELMSYSLKMALKELPPEEQTIITLYYYQESSINEIADITGISSSNVKVKLFRVRKKLHERVTLIMKDKSII